MKESWSARSLPLEPKDIWASRIYLHNAHVVRELA